MGLTIGLLQLLLGWYVIPGFDSENVVLIWDGSILLSKYCRGRGTTEKCGKSFM
jgi:hypothetical protein